MPRQHAGGAPGRMGGSWLCPPVLLDSGHGTRHVRLAIDDVALVHHDGRDAGDAQAPCVGNALICGSDAALEVGAAAGEPALDDGGRLRSEEHTSALQSLMPISYAVFCLKKKNKIHIKP